MFMKSLEDMATGSLDWAKEKALKAAAELLAAKPEGEARLLALIVNKLGDPSRRVASNAGYLISRLLTQHPLMGMVVVREVETFLFRCAPSPPGSQLQPCSRVPRVCQAVSGLISCVSLPWHCGIVCTSSACMDLAKLMMTKIVRTIRSTMTETAILGISF